MEIINKTFLRINLTNFLLFIFIFLPVHMVQNVDMKVTRVCKCFSSISRLSYCKF